MPNVRICLASSNKLGECPYGDKECGSCSKYIADLEKVEEQTGLEKVEGLDLSLNEIIKIVEKKKAGINPTKGISLPSGTLVQMDVENQKIIIDAKNYFADLETMFFTLDELLGRDGSLINGNLELLNDIKILKSFFKGDF